MLWLQVLWIVPCTKHQSYCKIRFFLLVAIKIAVFESFYQNSCFCILLRKFQKLAGVSHDFLISVLSHPAFFCWSNKLWASILLLTSEKILVFIYRWMGSSRIFFVVPLSAWFMLPFNFEKFASTPVSSITSLVMSWPSVLLAGVSVCFLNIC